METMSDFGLELIKVLGYLALVLLMLTATVYGLKRFGSWARKSGTSASIEVLAQRPLALKHHLVVVRVQEQVFLLGISPQGMHFLSTIHDPPPTTIKDEPT